MELLFRSELAPPASLIKQLADCDPNNPFCTPEYVTASESLGAQACFLGLGGETEVASGCIGLVSGSFLRRTLLIHSLPSLPTPDVFWAGLLGLCRRLKVWHLQIDSFASQSADIPHLPGELTRRNRWEYVLDIGGDGLLDSVRRTHRGNISRAVKAGLSVRRSREVADCNQHMELISASMDRRAKRGEDVEVHQSEARPLALLNSGLGELFQAVREDQVLSSMLILRSNQGAYWQSAGTRPEGLKLGASPFLLSRVAAILKEEGSSVFNLGGATDDNPGLRSFKAGFGAREVPLQAASFCPQSSVARGIHKALRTGWGWVKR